jgi:hypothetical protein
VKSDLRVRKRNRYYIRKERHRGRGRQKEREKKRKCPYIPTLAFALKCTAAVCVP